MTKEDAENAARSSAGHDLHGTMEDKEPLEAWVDSVSVLLFDACQHIRADLLKRSYKYLRH